MTGSEASPTFRLAYVPGVTPAKWVRIWNERLPDVPLTLVQVPCAEAAEALRGGAADAGIVRLPVDRTFFSAIPLYTETTVVVVPKGHLITAADEVSLEDLAEEVVFHPLDDVIDWSARRLARFKCPTSVEFVDELPHSTTGKVAKGRLRESA